MQAPHETADIATSASPRTVAWVRRITALVVLLVAAIAAVASYRHGLEVVHAAGEHGRVANLIPGSADGVIFAASMVILYSAITHTPVPILAKLGLAFGIGATLAMNVAAGARHGIPGALVSALPAVALVVAYELLMILVRGGRARLRSGTPTATVIQCRHAVAKSAEDNVVTQYLHGRDCLGEEPSKRQLSAITGVHRDKVAKLVAPYEQKFNLDEPVLNGSAATS